MTIFLNPVCDAPGLQIGRLFGLDDRSGATTKANSLRPEGWPKNYAGEGRGVSRVLFPQPSLWDERRRSPRASLAQVRTIRVKSPWCTTPQRRGAGLAADGVCLAASVSSGTGALLPHRFTLTGLPRPSAFCCTIPSGCPAQPLAGIMPCAARTFLWWFTPAAAPSSHKSILAQITQFGKDGFGQEQRDDMGGLVE